MTKAAARLGAVLLAAGLAAAPARAQQPEAATAPPDAPRVDVPTPPRKTARLRGLRDAANAPNAIARGAPLTPTRPLGPRIPLPAPATPSPPASPPPPLAPAGPSEPTHLPTGAGDLCRKPPNGHRRVHVTLKPDAELGDLIAWISSITCKQFILPGTIPANSKKVTFVFPSPISVDEAYRLFLAALDTSGLTVEPNGRFLRIIETSKAKGAPIPLYVGDAPPRARPSASGALVTRFVRVERADAAAVAARLEPLRSDRGDIVVATGSGLIITDAESNVARMVEAIAALDRDAP